MRSARTAQSALTWTRPDPAAAWAVATGSIGVLANVLLVLFFVLAPPWRDPGSPWEWLGPANDVVIVAQFAAFLPVPLALRERLPGTWGVRAATIAALAAMVAVVVLQFLLVVGLLSFETQVLYVSAAFLVVFLWILVVCRTAYRTTALPRRIVRAGLLIGSAFPLGVVVAAIALLAPDGSPARYVGFGVGAALGAASWLALPVWPLLLAGRVFVAPPADRGNYREGER
jgi:hypothetical protein